MDAIPLDQASRSKLLIGATKHRQYAGDGSRGAAGFNECSFIDAKIVAGNVERINPLLLHVQHEGRQVAAVSLTTVLAGESIANPRHESGGGTPLL